MRRYLNGEALLEGILYLAFSATIFYLTYGEKYLLFVTPRMKPYLYFTAVVMFVFAFTRLLKIGKPKYRQNRGKCLVLALPLLVLLLPYGTLNAGATQAGYTNVTAKADNKTEDVQQEPPIPSEAGDSIESDVSQSNVEQSSAPSISVSGPETIVPSGLDEANRSIMVSDEEFYQWLVELSYHPEKYEGFTIRIHGTVFRDETLAENEFGVTRLVMSCCVADLSPYGPLCLMDGAAQLEQDKWVSVEGTLHYNEGNGLEIVVDRVEDAEPAEEEYLYPFSS